jgi:hypothetical protein
LGCPTCGTGLSGHFAPCEFCGLDQADLQMLRVFLASRGNMRDLERHLGVSYPTARARFDDLLRRLGLANGSAAGPAAAASAAAPPGPGSATSSSEAERLATLQALAEGSVDVETARQRLGGEA